MGDYLNKGGGSMSPAGPGMNKNYKRMTIRTGLSPTRRTFYEEDRYADMEENYGRPVTPRRGQRENQRRANGEDYYRGRTDGWDREKYKVPGYNANPKRMTMRTGLSPRNSYAESTASRFSQKGFGVGRTMSSQGPKDTRNTVVREPETTYAGGFVPPIDEKKLPFVDVQEVAEPLPYRLPIIETADDGSYQWSNIVRNFVPVWFTVIMGTGVVSTVLNNSPFQFPGLKTIANVIFAIDAVLFITFLLLSIARYTIWPHKFKELLAHPAQSLFLGTFPMAMSTLINESVFELFPTFVNKQALLSFLLTFWYIDVVISLMCCFYLPFVIMYKHDAKIENVTAAWLLPIVPTVVAAATGGVLAEVMTNDTQAVAVTVISYMLWGTSVPLALMVMTIYLFRLTMYNLPPRLAVPSTFVALGPLFQGSFGIVQLGKVSRILFVRANFPTVNPQMVGEIFYAMGLMTGLILYGAGLVWMFFAIATVLKGPIPFSIGYWSFTFPLGVAASASISFGNEFNSLPFKIWSEILTYSVTFIWLGIFSGTAYRAVTGEFFRL